MAKNSARRISSTVKKIFISWSGEISKHIALELKKTLEESALGKSGLECFVSDADISSGTDWWSKVQLELKNCKMGVACITPDNFSAPWIYYEAGAIVSRGVELIPLLFDCSFKKLAATPLRGNQAVMFNEKTKFLKMMKDINDKFALCDLPENDFDTLCSGYYEKLKLAIRPELDKLENMLVFDVRYIYPPQVTTVTRNTIYISAPMSSLSKEEYDELYLYVCKLKPELEKIGFKKVESPLLGMPDFAEFDGVTRAVRENFSKLKQVDSMIVIYPKAQPTSALIEIGYGLALCKNMVIFYKDELPFMLRTGGEDIRHIKVRKIGEYSEITHIIRTNGKQLFETESEDDQ